jgi:hypothetical protein
MKTTLMTFLRVAGSTGAAILNSCGLTHSGCAGDSLGQDFRRTEVVKPDLDIGRSKGRDYSRMKNRIEYCKRTDISYGPALVNQDWLTLNLHNTGGT